jgi:hypothetical protein
MFLWFVIGFFRRFAMVFYYAFDNGKDTTKGSVEAIGTNSAMVAVLLLSELDIDLIQSAAFGMDRSGRLDCPAGKIAVAISQKKADRILGEME